MVSSFKLHKTAKMLAFGCVLAIMPLSASAEILNGAVNLVPQISGCGAVILDLNGAAAGTDVVFTLPGSATNRPLSVLFNAECSVAAPDKSTWLDLNIQLLNAAGALIATLAPSNSDNALCTSTGSSSLDSWVSASTNIQFTDGGPEVFFRDTRKFGKVQLLREREPSERLDKLGVDALAANGVDLYAAAKKRSAAIKSVLLDQSVLAGVGNIYADEALYLAGIRPTRAAKKLSLAECDRVVQAAQRVMQRSIETGGSSISDYIRPDGSDGGYQDERHVYAREGEPCLRCGTRIVRIVLGQRSSAYCPKCQR